jgi:hypothetical protein
MTIRKSQAETNNEKGSLYLILAPIKLQKANSSEIYNVLVTLDHIPVAPRFRVQNHVDDILSKNSDDLKQAALSLSSRSGQRQAINTAEASD